MVVVLMLQLFLPNFSLTENGQEITIEGQAKDIFIFTYNAKDERYIRFYFEQISTAISVEIFTPEGNVISRIHQNGSVNGSFLLPVHTKIRGIYQLKVTILRVFDEDTKEPQALRPGIFKVSLFESLTDQEYIKQKDSYMQDPRVSYLKENAVPLKDIDPNRGDNSDLLALKEMLGNVQVVMLGEPNHSTGEAFLAKFRLLKFLHEEMGFDVLAFESDFFGCDKAQELIEGKSPDANILWPKVISPWHKYNEFRPVINYFNGASLTEKPMILSGFDSQLVSTLSREYLAHDLALFLVENNLYCPDEGFFSILQHCLRYDYSYSRTPALSPQKREEFQHTARSLLGRIQKHNNQAVNTRSAFWVQVLKSLLCTLPWQLSLTSSPPIRKDNPYVDSYVYGIWRDKQMGDNISWLANHRFPNRKIIVWAASVHQNYNHRLGNFVSTKHSLNIRAQMGNVVRKSLGNRVYSIAVIGFEGYIGIPIKDQSREQYQIPIVEDQYPGLELEEMFAYAGFENAFFDLKPKEGGSWLQEPFPARPYGYSSYMAPWPKVLDAFLFVRKVNAVTLVQTPD